MQQTHLHVAHQRYPWELTDETRQIGKQGLARVREILHAKVDGPAQQRLELRFDPPAPVSSIGHRRPSPAAKGPRHSKLAA
jgi:hypothetical protein